MMREEIKNILADQVQSVDGRVWELSAPDSELPKPYLILREGVQSGSEPYAGFTTLFEVWPYASRTTFTHVDSISKEVISALHRKNIDVNGISHYMEYIGTVGEDVVDEERNALTKGLRFQVFSLAWLLHTPIDPDPAEAMKTWTENIFPMLQTNPEDWSPSNDTPALYWRQASIQGVEPTNWGAWITARLHGHIIAPDVSVRKEWTELVSRKLALASSTKMSDGSILRFFSISTDSGSNPFNTGQIQLDVQFGILQESNDVDRLQRIEVDPLVGGVING